MRLKGLYTDVLLILLALSVQDLHAQDTARHWLWPDHYKLQFAGGIGFFSVGAGYENKKQWLEGDLFYGYVPGSVGGVSIHALTGKVSVFPLPVLGNSVQVKPLAIGLMLSYSFGKQYFGFTPSNYPYDYYGFPTSFHAGAFLGGQINKIVKGTKLKQVGLYYEVITFDKEFISYLNNRNALKLSDVINIGAGIKVGF
jgi:hypothetical protein